MIRLTSVILAAVLLCVTPCLALGSSSLKSASLRLPLLFFPSAVPSLLSTKQMKELGFCLAGVKYCAHVLHLAKLFRECYISLITSPLMQTHWPSFNSALSESRMDCFEEQGKSKCESPHWPSCLVLQLHSADVCIWKQSSSARNRNICQHFIIMIIYTTFLSY